MVGRLPQPMVRLTSLKDGREAQPNRTHILCCCSNVASVPNGGQIKPSIPARACVREALSQLLEYSFWPGSQEAESLIIVGERPIDFEIRRYLNRLQTQFSLPIEYQQFDLEKGRLLP
jgi:hypothetical protein